MYTERIMYTEARVMYKLMLLIFVKAQVLWIIDEISLVSTMAISIAGDKYGIATINMIYAASIRRTGFRSSLPESGIISQEMQ